MDEPATAGAMSKAKKPSPVLKSAGVQVTFPDGFGRAVEKLADTIRHVIDLSFSPNRIRKKIVAEAEGQATALVIRAQGCAQVRAIEARAATRIQKLEVRRQSNIESIVRKAADELPPKEQVSEQPVNGDWTSRFFQECQDISDEQMQQIWARILARSHAPAVFHLAPYAHCTISLRLTPICFLRFAISHGTPLAPEF